MLLKKRSKPDDVRNDYKLRKISVQEKKRTKI